MAALAVAVRALGEPGERVLGLGTPIEQRPDQGEGGVPLGGLAAAVGLVVAGGVADLDEAELVVLGDGGLVLGVEVVVPS